ncbi:MAG: hypothetical protein KJ574_03325, partial [Nanoarchaeota archaeon]|nr:hypothetical protein [Nanoarchaeota archaeon]
YDFDGAVMITASHLDSRFNGIKLCKKHAIALTGPSGIYEIGELVRRDKFLKAKKKGALSKKSIKKEYLTFMMRSARKTNLKIAVDCGNGMGYLVVEFLRRIADMTVLYEKPNFLFPNHLADPNKKESHTAIRKLMKKRHFDLGIILDGDCDRVGFLDEKARFIPMDHVTGMLAHYFIMKSSHKHQKIVYDVRTTRAVPEVIASEGGIPIISRSGHSFIKQMMIKNDALFGGEKTGHYFFKHFHYADNALLAIITMLNYISDSRRPCSELARQFDRYAQIEETNFKVRDKDKILKEIESHFKRRARKLQKIDGITVYLANGWFNLRKSNTEELVRLNAEARTRTELKKITSEAIKLIRNG